MDGNSVTFTFEKDGPSVNNIHPNDTCILDDEEIGVNCKSLDTHTIPITVLGRGDLKLIFICTNIYLASCACGVGRFDCTILRLVHNMTLGAASRRVMPL